MFNTCDTQQCINITIVDDETLENEEVIIFALRTPDQDSRIIFDPPVANITISANDGIYSYLQ